MVSTSHLVNNLVPSLPASCYCRSDGILSEVSGKLADSSPKETESTGWVGQFDQLQMPAAARSTITLMGHVRCLEVSFDDDLISREVNIQSGIM